MVISHFAYSISMRINLISVQLFSRREMHTFLIRSAILLKLYQRSQASYILRYSVITRVLFLHNGESN